MKLSILGAILVIATAAQAYDEKGDSKALQGTWLPTSAVLAGQPFPEQVIKTMKLTMKDGRYTVMVGQVQDEGTAKLDSSKTPKTMEIKGTEGPNNGKTFLAIYKITGDTLTICYDLAGKAYPTEFESKPSTKLFLVEYKRDKSTK